MCSPDFCPTAASPMPCCCCPPGLKAWNNPVAFEFSEEQKASKRLTSDRGLCSMSAEDGENSSWGGYEESRFSLPGSGGGDDFQNSIIQHSSHVLASCQPALWKGIRVTLWTRSFQISSLLSTSLWTQYPEQGVHTDQPFLYFSSGASFSFYSSHLNLTWAVTAREILQALRIIDLFQKTNLHSSISLELTWFACSNCILVTAVWPVKKAFNIF